MKALLLAASCFFVQVTSAQPVWLAERMLSEVSSPTIVIKNKEGQETERIDRAAVERSIGVLRRLSLAYGIPTPPLYVTPSSSPNAFATTTKDGRDIVAINTAMLRFAGDDDSDLAVVLGHELGHLKAHHTTDGVRQAMAIELIGALLGAAVDINQATHGKNTAGLGMQLGAAGGHLVNAKFTRDQEREADQLGITAMAKAGFDPAVAQRFWSRMGSSVGTGGSGTWFDTHPSDAERERAVAALAQQLRGTYAANVPNTPSVMDPYPRSRYVGLEPTSDEIATASAYAKGRAAFKKKKYLEAAPPLREAADAGDERALALLGALALGGLGQPVDLIAAKAFMEQAAAKGFGRAIAGLGDMALTGKGAPQDPAEAARLFLLADARGDSHAAAQLAVLYASGRGVPKDAFTARLYAEKAASAGDNFGKAVFGVMVRDGVGGPKDPTRGAVAIAQVANEVPWASYQLGWSYEHGIGVGQDNRLAIEQYEHAASAGISAAQERLRSLSAH